MSQKNMSIFNLMKSFMYAQSFMIYLFNEKGSSVYKCSNCSSTQNKLGKNQYKKRCKLLGYEESPMAHTLFHKLKFPMQSDFYMCYQLSVNKKGISTLELSSQFGLSQKTCWFFKRKVQKGMESNDNYSLSGALEVDEFSIGGVGKGKPRRSRGKKKKVVLAIAKVLNKKEKLAIGSAYSKNIDDFSTASTESFSKKRISKDSCPFKDPWSV